MIKHFLLVVAFFLSFAGFGASVPSFKKVTIVVFENTRYSQTIKQPFFNKLAETGVNFTNFHAQTHPSQPNYLAMVSGSTWGVTTNDNVTFDVKTIADLLEEKGKTWKSYGEDYPGNCFLGAVSGDYARKHFPFVSFKPIFSKPERCAKLVDGKQYFRDWKEGTLPDFSFYVPNQKSDGHDTGIAFADDWYKKTFGGLVDDPRYLAENLLITTFDEADIPEPTNHIYTVFNGWQAKKGFVSNKKYDLYHLLRTLEAGFGTGTLGKHDAEREPITDVWVD